MSTRTCLMDKPSLLPALWFSHFRESQDLSLRSPWCEHLLDLSGSPPVATYSLLTPWLLSPVGLQPFRPASPTPCPAGYKDLLKPSPLSGQRGLLALAGLACMSLPSQPVGGQLEIHGQKMPCAVFPFHLAERSKFSESLSKKTDCEHSQYLPGGPNTNQPAPSNTVPRFTAVVVLNRLFFQNWFFKLNF